jgi:hypothetical protein
MRKAWERQKKIFVHILKQYIENKLIGKTCNIVASEQETYE